jgi:hypothetical protein
MRWPFATGESDLPSAEKLWKLFSRAFAWQRRKKERKIITNIVIQLFFYVQNEEILGIFFLSDKKLAVELGFFKSSTFFLPRPQISLFIFLIHKSLLPFNHNEKCVSHFSFLLLIKNISIVKW